MEVDQPDAIAVDLTDAIVVDLTDARGRMSRFSGPEVANMLHAFMRLRYAPSPAWLSAAQRSFKASFGTSCTAPSLAKALFALAKLGVGHICVSYLEK
jgi:hypothetical protein